MSLTSADNPQAAAGTPVSGQAVTPVSGGRPRRLIARDPAGVDMTGLGEIVFTGIPNANTQSPITVHLQVQCDLEYWHDTDAMAAPQWDVNQ